MSYPELSLSVCIYDISVPSLLHPNILQNHVIFLFTRSQMIPSLFPMHFSMWLNILVIIVPQFCWDNLCKGNFLSSLLLPLEIIWVSQQMIQMWLNMAEESSVQHNCTCFPEGNNFVTRYAKTYTFETDVTKVNQSWLYISYW